MGLIPLHKPSRRKMEQLYIKARMHSLSNDQTKHVKPLLKSIGNGYDGSVSEFKKTVLPYWEPFGRKPEKYWFDLFCRELDHYEPRYIPDTVWYNDILPYFNYIAINKAYRDKGMYSRILADVKKPETVAKNIAGYYFNGDGDRPISLEEAIGICEKEEHLIIKPSVNSGSGRSITFFDRDDPKTEKIADIFSRFKYNFVVQRLVKQHPQLAAVNERSLNTIRVVSFYFKGEVHILSTILRMGGVGARVDNFSAGGISCRIMPDGRLDEKAIKGDLSWTDEHPSGIKFRDISVPSFDKVIETVKRLHPTLPYFAIIGWDYAVDDCGDPVFIEFNIMPEPNQFSCGTTFGELTDDVLKDVFIDKTRKNAFY